MPIPRVLEPEVMAGADEAGEYDEMDFSETDQRFAERAALLARGTRLIVDIGSGNAKIPLAMCSLLPPEAAVCAVEMSAQMLAVAARNRARLGVARLHLITGDAKRLPFDAASIGMVTSNSLVHHIPDPRAVFHEIARVCRPGASLLIRDLVRPETESGIDQILARHAAAASPLQRSLFGDSLRAALTLAEVRGILDECGLGDVTLSQITDRHWSAERA